MIINGIIRITNRITISSTCISHAHIISQARTMCIRNGIVHPETMTDNIKKKTPLSIHSNTKIRQKPKTEEDSIKVTLLNGDNVTIVSLTEAKKIATRRDLKLIKILDMDMKSKRPVYRLMSGQEYFEEDVKQRKEKKEAKAKLTIKGEKLLTMSSKIGNHDFLIKMNNLTKWLNKSYEVRIAIEGDVESTDLTEEIYKRIEKEYGHLGRILQKRNKGGDIRFQMLPPKNENAQSVKTEDPQDQESTKATIKTLKKENAQSVETEDPQDPESTKATIKTMKKGDDQITIQQTRAIHTSSSDGKSL